MNIVKSYCFQKGFFDLGIGLALFAIFGTTALLLAPGEKNEESEINVQQKQNTPCKDEKKYQENVNCKKI